MKKGFTLLELVIVIIIIGVLATLGFAQYVRMVEKARGAEARGIIGTIRDEAASIYMAKSSCATCTDANLGIGATGYPGPAIANCRGTHLFAYITSAQSADGLTIRANRCEVGGSGKDPVPAGTTGYIQDVVNYTTGADTVTQSAAY